MRFLVLGAAVCCALASAQSPPDVFDKAPPHIEKALRERVAKFMEAHISGKFRAAEEVVHEDSQDIFYDSQKRRLIGYEIVRINWSENFSKAVVVTQVEMDWYTPRLGKVRVKPPMTSYWKVDAGQWWWYAIPQTNWQTPFGAMSPGAESERKPSGKWTVPDVEALHRQVEADKLGIRLVSHEASEDSSEIRNNMEGEIRLSFEPALLPPGLQVTLSKDALGPGESAKVHFRYSPPDRSVKATHTVNITVSPIEQVFPFVVTFAVPPEFEKYIPKNDKK